jgi:hypothetical protein
MPRDMIVYTNPALVRDVLSLNAGYTLFRAFDMGFTMCPAGFKENG